MLKRSISVAAVACALFAADARAGYQEAHQTGDDVHIVVDAAGGAEVLHAITYRVAAGALKTFDLNGIDRNAVVEPEANITGEEISEPTKGAKSSPIVSSPPTSAHVTSSGDRALRVTIDDAKGLKRGTYVVRLRYHVNLVEAHALVRDGAMWRLVWTSPIAPEGRDSARVTIELPPAPTEPQVVRADVDPNVDARLKDPGANDPNDDVIATLRRTAESDAIELVRAHVAHGEAAAWAVRIDPKALPQVTAPELRPPPIAPEPPPQRVHSVIGAAALIALAFGFGALVRAKTRAFAERCARAGTKSSPLVPMPDAPRAWLSGIALAAAVLAQTNDMPMCGAIAILVAMALVVARTPDVATKPRGPGEWLALRADDAFARAVTRGERHAWLDAGTRDGKIALAVTALVLAAAAFALRFVSPDAPYLVAIDALVLAPIFFTGRASQLPPDPFVATSRLLAPIYRASKRDSELRVSPWARVPTGSRDPDELRLLITGRAPMPGLVGVELGVAWNRTATSYVAAFEALVRVQEMSPAAARMATLAPDLVPVPGRKPDERVFRFAPSIPTSSGARALATKLAGLVGEARGVRPKVPHRARKTRAPYDGPERRLPPNVRARAPQQTA